MVVVIKIIHKITCMYQSIHRIFNHIFMIVV